ncbi:hypothetical protein CDAR_468381 [Caerostris darwini]|uniref:Uncharacterized protein n=1 Tax=Caerostris darwini TaxID=1538125 RepID=A0AAV4WW20_9ARAC|nr:hypothetical protein CDAR_468381 [Caerostris darwini]
MLFWSFENENGAEAKPWIKEERLGEGGDGLVKRSGDCYLKKGGVGKREWEKDRELHHVSDVTASPRRIVLTEIRQDNPPSTGSAGTGPMAAGS